MRSLVVAGLMLAMGILPIQAGAEGLGMKLAGKILLDVEQSGEAWYVNPKTETRTFLYRPETAFQVMREQGIGISNTDLDRIPIGYVEIDGVDTDRDGLSDLFEQAIGSDPTKVDSDQDGIEDFEEIAKGRHPAKSLAGFHYSTPDRLRGSIFLQVESAGEAWWVNPVDGKRYYLGRPTDAFQVMRTFGLGVASGNLETIPVSETVVDCDAGADYKCFAEMARVNQQAKFTTGPSPVEMFGVEAVSQTDYTLLRNEEGRMVYKMYVITGQLEIDGMMRERLKEHGYTDLEIDQIENEAVESQEEGGVAVTTCEVITSDLAGDYLEDWLSATDESSEGWVTEMRMIGTSVGDLAGIYVTEIKRDGIVALECAYR